MMNSITRALLVGTVMAFGSATLALAADAVDPVVGTWVLNPAKSKFNPGPAPKSQTRTYTQTADGTHLMIRSVAADGAATATESTFKYDGKTYPFTGSPNYDSLSLQRVNGSTVKSTLKKAGKVVGTTTRTLSGHGKVLTVATKGTDAQGAAYNDVSVYDKH